MTRFARVFLLTSVICAAAAWAVAADGREPDIVLSAERLAQPGGALLDQGWRYHPGDDPQWAHPEFDDSGWERVDDPVLPASAQRRSTWHGIGWFRLTIRVGAELSGKPVGLVMAHPGASEVYLDGALVRRFGTVGSSAESEDESDPAGIPVGIALTADRDHVIAVRYSFHAIKDGDWNWLGFLTPGPGFEAALRPLDEAIRESVFARKSDADFRLTRAIFLLAIGLVHLALFAFMPAQRANLFLSLAAFSWFTNILGIYLLQTSDLGPRGAVVAWLCFAVFGQTSILLTTAFFYSAFGERVPRAVWVLVAGYVVATLAAYVAPRVGEASVPVVLPVVAGASIVLTLRVVARAWRSRADGAGILGFGALLFLAVPVRDTLTGLGILSPSREMINVVSSIGALAVCGAASLFLARRFARTSTALEAELERTRALSAEMLERERRAAEAELERERERAHALEAELRAEAAESQARAQEAEYRRRTRELEEARQLQLSMLPQRLPELEHLDLAAYMKPASEVGGDYYDFHLETDGTLTLVVGDATGHGLKAGTLVSATKSLFKALACEPHIPTLLRAMSAAIKAMNLKQMYMAVTVVKVNGTRLRASAAGMPPVLIYRAATGEVEELKMPGMPLGGAPSFPYKEYEAELRPGDAVLLQSDGLSERFNDEREMFDEERVKRMLVVCGAEPPAVIIERLVAAGDRWAADRPQDDDTTLVVLQVKAATATEPIRCGASV